jgi:hypothetical protein
MNTLRLGSIISSIIALNIDNVNISGSMELSLRCCKESGPIPLSANRYLSTSYAIIADTEEM